MPNRELFYPHTLKFDVSSIKRKRHIADLPYINVDISAAFRYNVKTECALVFPIYGTAPNFGHHLYAKSAIYAALTFLLNTDLKAYGVQVYFAIGDMYADEILPYFQKASIPTQCIAVFDQHYLAHQLATTAAVFCDELKAVSKFLLIDADMYVHRPAGSPVLDLFGPLLASWTRPFCWGYWGDAGKSDWHPFSVEYYHYQSQNEMEIYWEKLSDLVNTPVQVVKRLFHIDDRTIPRGLGWFAGFDVARAIKDSAFYDFFLQRLVLNNYL